MNDFIITPIAGAVIGYFTNWLAIKMLFRPYTQKYLFGIRLPFTPGLIPKERYRLSQRIGETIAAHVLTGDMLRRSVMSDENMREIERGLREFLLNAKAPVAGMLTEKYGELCERLSADGALWLLPKDSIAIAERVIYEGIPKLTELIRGLPPEATVKLVDLTGRVIDEAVGRLAGAFINSERVYTGIANNLCEYLDTEENRVEVSRRLSEQLAEFLGRENIAQLLPWESAQVSQTITRFIGMLFDMAADELMKSRTVRAGLAQAIGGAMTKMDIGRMTEEQINAMDMQEAEAIVQSVVKRELTAITLVGGVLGLIIGLIPGIIRLLGL